LLDEQLRSLADEESIVKDTSTYSSTSGSAHDWQTRVSKSFTLTKQKLVYIQWNTYMYNSRGLGRVTSGSTPIASTGAIDIGATVTWKIWVLLAAGSYTLNFQTAVDSGGTNFYARVSDIIIAAFVFPDMTGAAYDSGNVYASHASTTNILNQNITVPATRTLPVGAIRDYLVTVVCYLYNTSSRLDYPQNSGESDASSALSWKVFWESAQDSWADRKEDVLTVTSKPSYGIGAYGLFVKRVTAGSSQATKNLTIKVYNNTGSTKQCRCYVRVFICPWVLTDSESHQPVDFSFPPASTFYATLEPLGENNSKASQIGKVRGVSFGDSTDFYSSASGTGLLTHNYTFENVDAAAVLWFVKGLNTCISYLGVDVR